MTSRNNVEPFPDRRPIDEQAAGWIALRDRRELTPEERVEFEAWLSRSPQHADAHRRMTRHWNAFDELAELQLSMEAGVAPISGETRRASSSKRRTIPRWTALGVAAACMALVMLGVLVWKFLPSPAGTMAHGMVRTAFGEQKTIALTDGSKLILNTNSIVDVQFTPAARNIHLRQGEVYVEVAHERGRPFLVYAGDGAVRAVGTAFAVSLREATVEVTVTHGRVQLLGPDARQHAPSVHGPPQPTAMPLAEIAAGDDAQFSGSGVKNLKPLSAEELNRKLIWRRGYLAFAGEPLSQALKEVSRYTEIKVEISDPELESLPVGGYFRVGDVDEFLLALKATFGIKVERISAHHVKLSRAS